MELPQSSPSSRALSWPERLELIKALNGMPLSQLLELEIALAVPLGVMPVPSEAQGIRNRALLTWVEGPTGTGLIEFLEVLREATGFSLTGGPVRLELVIDVSLDKADASLLLEMLAELKGKANAPTIQLSGILPGSIKLRLQGSLEELKRLNQVIESEALAEVAGQQVISARILLALNGADLSNADLSNADLSGADLSFVNLSGAILSGADLSGADLRYANLGGANLHHAYLSQADLFKANLGGAVLYKANLCRADLSFADLSRANLSDADLSFVNLSLADLRRVNLSRANLNFARLSFANLRFANLISVNLSDVGLSNTVVTGAVFGGNPGLAEEDQADLIRRGAIFQDISESGVPAGS